MGHHVNCDRSQPARHPGRQLQPHERLRCVRHPTRSEGDCEAAGRGRCAEGDTFRVWGDQSERKTAKNCFFPIYVQDEGVVGFGEVPPDDFHPESAVIDQGDGRYEVWPIDNSRTERKWRNQRKTIDQVAHLLRPEWSKGQLQIRIDKDTAMHKTVWSGSRYDAGSHGKRLLNKVLGVDFDYPKSLYAMRDILYACTGNRKDAVILDYLAGSGTTSTPHVS